MIFPMTANTANQKSNDVIKRKIIRYSRNRTRQTRRQVNLILPNKVIIKARYAIKRRTIQKRGPIKLFTKLTAKFLTVSYKSNIMKFKLNEDPLHRRIYFFTLIESMEMISLQYKENCEVLLDYP